MSPSEAAQIGKPVPVIVDTDIGFDVDDVWALAFLLRCPEIDLRLVVTENGDTTYAAGLVSRLLEIGGRTDVPIGVGIPLTSTPPLHADSLGGYSPHDYSGPVRLDGVGALIEEIRSSAEPVTVLAIGPLANIASAVQRAPDIVDSCRFVGMHGSIRSGYGGSPRPNREYNVYTYPRAAETVFASGWDMTITPLDTCGLARLTGDRFAQLRASQDPLARAVLAAHDEWCAKVEWRDSLGIDPAVESSVLYDTVAAYLAFAEEFLVMEELPISVDDQGRTVIDEHSGHLVRCATEWSDLDGFLDLLMSRLCP